MKILLIHNHYQQPGGEDYVFEAEGTLLAQHGHRVERLVFHNGVIRTLKDKLAAVLGILYNRKSAKLLERKIESFRPDIIHVHNFIMLASPAIFLVAKKYGIPVVLTLHNYRLICPGATLFYDNSIYEKSIRSKFPLHAILNGVYRDSIFQTAIIAIMTGYHRWAGTWKNLIDRYIVLTNFAGKKFQESTLAIPEHKFYLKPNFVSDYGKGKRKRDNFVLFVGRLTVEKGILVLVKSAQNSGFNLTIIGDGPLASLVEDASRRYTNINYLGFKLKGEVLYYMKRCKALVFPSIWYEGFPITILEAFSTGTPVITSSLGSMAEIVTDGFNGLHFVAGNENDLGHAVEVMMTNRLLAENLAVNARITYLRKFTPKTNYNKIMNVYNGVIAQKNEIESEQPECKSIHHTAN